MEVDDIQSQFTKFRRIGNNGGGRSSSDSSGKITNIGGGGTQKGQVKLDELEEEAGVVHPADEEEQEARRAPVKRSSGGGGMTMDMVVGGGGRLCGWPSSRIVRVSRASGGKDRHSKVLTSKGLRDRRVRLSVSTAIQFYDLQDRLGYEQPSKAVEWLLKAASSSINELPSLDASFSNKNDFKSGDAELDLDLDDLTTTTTNYNHHCHQPQQQSRKCSSTSETSKGSGGLSLSRSEIRIKARERARERTAVDKEKGKDNIIIVNNDESTRATATENNNNNNDDYNDKGDDVMNQSHHHRSHINLGVSRNASSFTDLLTGGMSISRRVSNNNNNNGTSSTPEINSPTDYEFFAVPASSSGAGAETSQQQIRPMAGRVSVPAEYQHQQNRQTNPNFQTNMATQKDTSSTPKTPKKTNLLDHHSIKHLLDESVSEIVTSRGYKEDVRMSNIRLLIGTVIIVIALFAQFYNKKFPDNKNFLIACIALYVVFNGILQLIVYTKEKNAILFTYPPEGSLYSTGLIVSSKLPRFSDMYTLTIASADPKSISAKPTVEFTKSVTKWFTKDGVLVEGLFWKDVEGLVNDYAKENKKSK